MLRCPICNKKFKSKQSLGGHMRSHKKQGRAKKERELSVEQRVNRKLLMVIRELLEGYEL